MPSAFNPSVLAGGSGSGVALEIPVALTTHGFSVGNWIYKTSTGYALSDSDLPSSADVIGVVSEVVDANNFKYIASGMWESASAPTGTAGDAYWITATPGAISTSPPLGAGDTVRAVGILIESGAKFLVTILQGYIVP